MSFVGKFVQFVHPTETGVFFGKVVTEDYSSCTVEYFIEPSSGVFDVFEVEVIREKVREHALKEKDFVYFRCKNGFWAYDVLTRNARTGQLYAGSMGSYIGIDQVYIPSKQLPDLSNRLLQNLTLSSRSAVKARTEFIQSFVRQRALAHGVESTTSSLVNLEDHQLNVAKRVLEDPLRRYVLADEVGLGKTIEAGFVVRQTMIDNNFDARICILCPEALMKQWSMELAEKFQLKLFLVLPQAVGMQTRTASIEIVSHQALKQKPGNVIYDLVIIDEAHKIMPRDNAAILGELFINVSNLTRNAKSVLLLSATPALHNELGFLSMLSIIDPISYKIDQIDDFKQKIEKRVDVAELIAGLSPSNLFLLDSVINRIRGLFSDSSELIAMLDDFEDYLLDVVDEADPVYLGKLSNLRSYLSEAYKLNHRVIKNRRKNLSFITQNRSGVEYVATSDRNGNFSSFNDRLEEWSIQQSIVNDIALLKNYAEMHFELRERIYRYYSGNFGQFGFYATNPNFVGNVEQFKYLLDQLRLNIFFNERVEALSLLLEREMHDRAKFVIFATCSVTADQIYKILRSNFGDICHRHRVEDEDWKAFVEGPFKAILVCDRSAEEGLNIQGQNRHIVHFDLPLNVNRIEQRMGRIDRYGGGEALKSFIILNKADKFEQEWAKLLKYGVQIFDQSVASLQYLIEDHLSGDEFKQQLLGRRTEYIQTKKRNLQGEQGLINKSLRQLLHEDKLEEIADPPEDTFYDLKAYDNESEDIQQSCEPWLRDQLHLTKEDRTQAIFELGYVSNPEKNTVLNREWLADIKAFEARATGVTNPIFTYNREAGTTTTGQKPSILRYGNTFLNSIFKTTRLLPIGKSSLTWIYQPTLNKILSEPIIVLKSHLLIEANFYSVQRAINTWEDPRFNLNSAIIRRRCDALYPPRSEQVVNSTISDILENRTVSALLNGIDEIETSKVFTENGFKFDISNENLGNFYAYFPGAQNWFDMMLQLTKSASSEMIKDHTDQFDNQKVVLHQILNKRLNRYKAILDGPTLALEERFNQLLIDAVRVPKLSFVASEAYILSGDVELTRHILSGRK
jgi:ATP-dependent helicase HepA